MPLRRARSSSRRFLRRASRRALVCGVERLRLEPGRDERDLRAHRPLSPLELVERGLEILDRDLLRHDRPERRQACDRFLHASDRDTERDRGVRVLARDDRGVDDVPAEPLCKGDRLLRGLCDAVRVRDLDRHGRVDPLCTCVRRCSCEVGGGRPRHRRCRAPGLQRSLLGRVGAVDRVARSLGRRRVGAREAEHSCACDCERGSGRQDDEPQAAAREPEARPDRRDSSFPRGDLADACAQLRRCFGTRCAQQRCELR